MRGKQRDFWDAYWSSDAPTVTARTMTQILDTIKLEYLHSILPGSGRTIEVGSGSGRISCSLAMEGYQTVCVDYSLLALEAARKNYACMHLSPMAVAGDAFRLPFRDEIFDVVLSTGLLEHFKDPNLIVAEMVRVLRPGGVFYSDIVPRKFSLFRSLDWVGRLKHALKREQANSFYERPFTAPEIRELLEGQALIDVCVFPAGVVPPYVPLLYRSRRLRDVEVSLVERTRGFWKRLDKTWLAEWLGFYYFAWAIKPGKKVT
jgi:SAM-dependent methyltransferase